MSEFWRRWAPLWLCSKQVQCLKCKSISRLARDYRTNIRDENFTRAPPSIKANRRARSSSLRPKKVNAITKSVHDGSMCDLQNPFIMLSEINEPSNTSQKAKGCVVIDLHYY